MATRAKTARARKSRQYVVDEKGQRTGVILTLEEYEELIEAAEQVNDVRHLEEAKRVKGKPVLWGKVKAELRADGKLP